MSSILVPRRPAESRHAPWALLDVGIAAGVAVASVLVLRGSFALTRPDTVDRDTLGVVAVSLAALPMIAWRRRPMAAFVSAAAASVAMAAIGYPIGLPFAPAVALYMLAAGRTREAPWTPTKTATVVVSLMAYLAATGITESALPVSETFHAGLLWAVAWFAGERTRLRRDQIEEFKREARRERRLAVAEERARIARDLHDSVGHALNVIGVRAGAARLRAGAEPERTTLALSAIEELARSTVAEIDQLVGALYERAVGSGDDRIDAPLGLQAVETLVVQHAATGFDITSTTRGDRRRLTAAVDQAAFRIVQESLTNASRHGCGSARLEITFGASDLCIVVTNPVAEPQTESGVGHGLVGMAERARLVGGRLETNRTTSEHVVCATIPYDKGLT
jgi:signal transduction histidine kinase